MRIVALIAFFASGVALGPAVAQEPAPPPGPPPPPATPAQARPPVYLGARLGAYLPSGDLQFLDVLDFGTGLDLEGFVGLPLSRHLALEGGVGYTTSGTDTLSAFDPGLGAISAKLALSVIPITASLRASTEVDRVTLSALAGVGYHMASLELTVSAPEVGLPETSVSEDDDVFGFHLGAAVSVALAPRLRLGAELRYTFASADFPSLLDTGGGSTELKLDGLRLGATLAFTP